MGKEFRISPEIDKSMKFAIILSIIGGGIFFMLCIINVIAFLIIPSRDSTINFVPLIFIVSSPFYFILGLIQWILAIINFWIIRVVRIITRPDELIMIQPGLELHTSWNNLSRIGNQSVLWGLRKYECLILAGPATQKTKWWFKVLKNKPEDVIPLSMFSGWKGSELGQELKRYAPQLFT
jgi:hypothetical protein